MVLPGTGQSGGVKDQSLALVDSFIIERNLTGGVKVLLKWKKVLAATESTISTQWAGGFYGHECHPPEPTELIKFRYLERIHIVYEILLSESSRIH
jgi:hypothetical protein